MQCRLVGKGEFSASIGTAGDWCAVSGGQVEVRSKWEEPQWRNFAGRWTCLPAKRTGRRGQPNGVTDVTNPRLGRWLAGGRQDQYLGHSRRSKQYQNVTILAFIRSVGQQSMCDKRGGPEERARRALLGPQILKKLRLKLKKVKNVKTWQE